jgi:predicted anti-sigma-YlaC factor YlaD
MSSAVVGTRSGFIRIPNNDVNENPFTIPVIGTVLAAAPLVSVQSGGQNVVDGQTLVNFGTGGLGLPGPTRTFTVTNQGGVTLALGDVRVPAGFTLVQRLSTTSLAPRASDSFVVRLDTTALGTRSGRIQFATSDRSHPTFSIPVTGAVVASVPVVTVQQGGTALMNGTPVDFGTVVQGTVGAVRTFTVTNSGTATLRLGAVTLPVGFTLVKALASSLAPGASGSFTVLMNATTVGTRSGAIRFSTNDPNRNPFVIPVTGAVVSSPTNVGPRVAVRVGTMRVVDGTTQVNFGSVTRGQPGPTRTFTVTNTGTQRLVLGMVRVPAGFTLVSGLESDLAPGESGTFTVRLNSGTLGTRSGVVRFANNVAGSNPFDIPVTGTVVSGPVPPVRSPEIVVRRGNRNVVDGVTTILFGPVVRGQVGPTRTFTVKNTGTATLRLGSVRVPKGFQLIKGLKSSLAPGKSATFTVRLQSASVGAKSGTIRFATNIKDENPFEIRVTGRVVAPDLFSQQRIADGSSA